MLDTSKTARNVVPSIFRRVQRVGGWVPGTVNFDIGSGKYHGNLTNALNQHLVSNQTFDSSFDLFHNCRTLRNLNIRPADTVTISNVFNVCQTQSQIMDLLYLAHRHLAENGIVYITTYPGNRSGIAKKTKDGYQQNKKLSSYLPIVRLVFSAEKIGGLIVAKKY